MKERMFDKLMSGKYFMTIATTVVFGVMSISGVLPVQFVSDIIKLVFIFYFLKQTDKQ